MAEAKKDAATEKMVEIRVPRGRSNGTNWLLPKGESSMVPDYVAAEYYRSLDAIDAYSASINNIQGEEQAVNASARAKIGG